MSARKKPIATQTKHRSVAEKIDMQMAEDLVKTKSDQIITPPPWLNSQVATDEWNRVIPQLLEIDIVGNLDLEAIAGYCNAFSNYQKAITALEQQGLLIVKEDEETGYSYVKENPLNNLALKWGTEMRRFADLCGLTVNSRIKAGQSKVDKQKEKITDEFGDI